MAYKEITCTNCKKRPHVDHLECDNCGNEISYAHYETFNFNGVKLVGRPNFCSYCGSKTGFTTLKSDPKTYETIVIGNKNFCNY